MSAAVLELLLGAKVFDGAAWHIYDATGAELTNPAGVRGLGKMGALLMWPRAEPAIVIRRPAGFVKAAPAAVAAHASVLLHVDCSVSAAAGLRIGASSEVNAPIEIDSTAGLRLGATVNSAIRPAISAGGDVHDVVLEMLLLTD